MASTVQSRKAKGRRLQQYVVSKILAAFPVLEPDDVSSRSMGAGGEDVLLSPKARQLLSVSFECKNKETISIYKEFKQAKENAGNYNPVLVYKKNQQQPLAIIEFDYFLSLLKELNNDRT